jgi:hypothetical protein
LESLLNSLAVSLPDPTIPIYVADESISGIIPHDDDGESGHVHVDHDADLPDDMGHHSHWHPGLDGLRTIRLPYDVGLSAGRNAALEHVTTPYFVLLDDDFVFHPVLTNLTALLAVVASGAADIAAGSLVLERVENVGTLDLDAEDAPVPYTYAELFDLTNPAVLRMRKGSLGTLPEPFSDCTFHHIVLNFFAARTDAVRRVGGWDADLKLGEHQEFFLRASTADPPLSVASCPDRAIALHDQDHTDHAYKTRRRREAHFLRQALAKHGFEELVLSTGPTYARSTIDPRLRGQVAMNRRESWTLRTEL